MISDPEIYRKCIENWGTEKQIDMVVEELSELILAIQKYKRNPSEETCKDISNEVADVELMIGQLGEMMNSAHLGYYTYLCKYRLFKRERIIKRLEK
jgi:hypothetical protein